MFVFQSNQILSANINVMMRFNLLFPPVVILPILRAVCFSETLVPAYQTKRCHNPDDHNTGTVYCVWQCYHSLEVGNITAEDADYTRTEHEAREDREQACNPCNKKTCFKQLDTFQSAVPATWVSL